MKNQIKLSIQRAAVEFGVSRETVRRGLRSIEIEPKATYTVREVHRALAGDLKFERGRLVRAQADAAELENRIREGATCELHDVEQWHVQFFDAMTCAMDAAPDDSCRDFIERVLKPAIRAKYFPKPKL